MRRVRAIRNTMRLGPSSGSKLPFVGGGLPDERPGIRHGDAILGCESDISQRKKTGCSAPSLGQPSGLHIVTISLRTLNWEPANPVIATRGFDEFRGLFGFLLQTDSRLACT